MRRNSITIDYTNEINIKIIVECVDKNLVFLIIFWVLLKILIVLNVEGRSVDSG